MTTLIDKIMPHIDKIVENIIEVGYNLGCIIYYSLGVDDIIEAINCD